VQRAQLAESKAKQDLADLQEKATQDLADVQANA